VNRKLPHEYYVIFSRKEQIKNYLIFQNYTFQNLGKLFGKNVTLQIYSLTEYANNKEVF